VFGLSFATFFCNIPAISKSEATQYFSKFYVRPQQIMIPKEQLGSEADIKILPFTCWN
jgi:hypothetical protein